MRFRIKFLLFNDFPSYLDFFSFILKPISPAALPSDRKASFNSEQCSHFNCTSCTTPKVQILSCDAEEVPDVTKNRSASTLRGEAVQGNYKESATTVAMIFLNGPGMQQNLMERTHGSGSRASLT